MPRPGERPGGSGTVPALPRARRPRAAACVSAGTSQVPWPPRAASSTDSGAPARERVGQRVRRAGPGPGCRRRWPASGSGRPRHRAAAGRARRGRRPSAPPGRPTGATSSTRCSMMTMPVPLVGGPAAAAWPRTSCAPTGSRSDSGSSRTRTRGRMASVAAMAVRCFCPPDSVTVAACRSPASPVTSRHQSTLAAISGWRQGQVLRPERHLRLHRLVDELEVRVLEHHADELGRLVRRQPAQRPVAEHHPAAQLAVHAGRDQPAQRQRQRGLAATRRAGDQHHLARRHAEVDVPQRGPDGAVVGERDIQRPQIGGLVNDPGPSAAPSSTAARSRRPGSRRRPAPWPRR